MFRSSRSCFEHIRCISVRPFHSHCKRHFCSHHRMHLKDRSFTQCEQSASRKRQSKNLRRCEQSNHSSDWRVEIATQTLQLHLICHVSAPAVPHLCIFWLSHCVLVCVCGVFGPERHICVRQIKEGESCVVRVYLYTWPWVRGRQRETGCKPCGQHFDLV